eukprot:g3676.t1
MAEEVLTLCLGQERGEKWGLAFQVLFTSILPAIDFVTDLIVTYNWLTSSSETHRFWGYVSCGFIGVAAIANLGWFWFGVDLAMCSAGERVAPLWPKVLSSDIRRRKKVEVDVLKGRGRRDSISDVGFAPNVRSIAFIKLFEFLLETTPEILLQVYATIYMDTIEGVPWYADEALVVSIFASFATLVSGMGVMFLWPNHPGMKVLGMLYFLGVMYARFALLANLFVQFGSYTMLACAAGALARVSYFLLYTAVGTEEQLWQCTFDMAVTFFVPVGLHNDMATRKRSLDALDVIDVTGFTPRTLKNAGVKAETLKQAGFILGPSYQEPPRDHEVPHLGFERVDLMGVYSCKDLLVGGFTPGEFFAAGYNAAELKLASCTAAQLKKAGFALCDLKAAAYNARELSAAGFGITELQGVGITAANFRAESFTAAELKDIGYSARQLKAARFPAKDLKGAGFTAGELANEPDALYSYEELARAGYSAQQLTDETRATLDELLNDCRYTVGQLKAAKYDASSLKRAGVAAADLRQASFTAGELARARFTCKDLKEAGYSAADLRSPGVSATLEQLVEAEYCVTELKLAGFALVELFAAGLTIEELKKSGTTAAEFKEVVPPCSPAELMRAGYSVAELTTVGYSATQLKRGGASVHDLKAAGFTVGVLHSIGFSAQQLFNAKFRLPDLKKINVGVAEAMDAADCSPIALARAGYSAKELRDAGLATLTEMKQKFPYDAADLKGAHFGAEELKGVGCTAAELKRAGFAASELASAGFALRQLKAVGFTAGELSEAGFTIGQLRGIKFTAADFRQASFTAEQLKGAGFTVRELYAARFSVRELLDAKFGIAELQGVGVTAANFKAASFTAAELKDIGYSARQLKAARFPAKDLKGAGF